MVPISINHNNYHNYFYFFQYPFIEGSFFIDLRKNDTKEVL